MNRPWSLARNPLPFVGCTPIPGQTVLVSSDIATPPSVPVLPLAGWRQVSPKEHVAADNRIVAAQVLSGYTIEEDIRIQSRPWLVQSLVEKWSGERRVEV